MDTHSADHLGITSLVDEFATLPSNCDDRYQLRVEHRDGILILRIVGFLLQPIPIEFTERFERLLGHQTVSRVLIDLSACTYMSSSVMGYLVKYFDLTNANGGMMVMVRPNDKVIRVLKAIGLDSFFEFHADETTALAALGQ